MKEREKTATVLTLFPSISCDSASRNANLDPETIVIPVDLAHCPIEVFGVANGLASRANVAIVLLHVINLNICSPENRVFDELGRQAGARLERLAKQYLPACASTTIRVRFGDIAEEILHEADEQEAHLLLLADCKCRTNGHIHSCWRHPRARFVSGIRSKILQKTSCGVFILPARTVVNYWN